MEVSEALRNPLVSILIGGAITWICAWFYYKRAGDQLRKEAALLQKATSAIIYLLEHREAEIKVQRDDAGRTVGLIVSARAHARGTSTTKRMASDTTADA